jgi:ArsR family transcriptional regulator
MRLKHFNLPVGAQLMKALGDEARIRILNLLLAAGGLTITDLELILDFTQTKTSRHVTYLKNSGILSTKKYDQWVIYSIKEESVDVIKQIMAFFEKDSLLQNDIAIYAALQSNRELFSGNRNERK